jgi:hypothetical protein
MEDGDDMDVSFDGATSKRAVRGSATPDLSQMLTTHCSATLVEQESQYTELEKPVQMALILQNPM